MSLSKKQSAAAQKKLASAFFSINDEGWFVGNGPARGPWSVDACHAGPVTGVIARAVEQLVEDKQLVRLTVEMVRPVPMSGFKITTELRRNGRMVTTAAATVTDVQGKVVAVANSLHLMAERNDNLPTASLTPINFDQSSAGEFPIVGARHGLPFFGDGVEVRYPPGETNQPGPTTLWMKALPLLETEQPSPFQRLCPLADCGNGVSRNLELTEASFVNPDITIAIYRLPESEWLASSATSFWQPSGVGMAQATLFDKRGAIGTAIQTLLVHPV